MVNKSKMAVALCSRSVVNIARQAIWMRADRVLGLVNSQDPEEHIAFDTVSRGAARVN